MKSISLSFILIFALSCSRSDTGFDAMGHFEADEYMLTAESGGRIIQLDFKEGSKIRRGDTVAITDTISVYLQLQQSKAQQAAVESKIPGINAQEKVVATEISVLKAEKERFENLFTDKATSEKSLDDIVHQIDLANARKGTFSTQIASLRQDVKVIMAQQNILTDQLRKCRVISPADGIVIDLIAKPSDLMTPGKPILKLADIEQIILKAYISEDQLSMVKLSEQVKVRIDSPDGRFLEYPGQVFWISDQAEFTPKVIQTKKERVNLVYAVKVRVNNDGRIKIGMPGELFLVNE
ncbi:MAG: HlyD family efflux transporter periplasmic adaptor subunit [Bacteroidia bacterium]|nr:HlyD family efflux transporter periplasmic adaptor subunit [Bacteroidia bacterium]